MGKKEIVADDGLHQVEQITVTDQDGPAAWEEMAKRMAESADAATFEGAIGEAEQYWQGVPPDPHATWLSKPGYASRILRDIAWLRKVVALPNQGNLESWIVSAMDLGSTLKDAEWRFGYGGEARRGLKLRRKNRENARAGVRIKEAERGGQG